jgi:hypothetical protein
MVGPGDPRPSTAAADAGDTARRGPRVWRGASIAFAIALFLVASLWVLLAVSLPMEPGEPCGGETLNVIQKLIATVGWVSALVSVAGGLSDPAKGGRRIGRGTVAAIACFVIWWVVVRSASC